MVTAKRTRRRIRSTVGERVFDAFNITFMFAFMVLMLFPFYDVVIQSIASTKVYFGPFAIPKATTLDAYKLMLSYRELWLAYGVTALRSICVVTGHVLVGAMAAYALSKNWLPLNGIITKLMLFTMLFGGGMIPTYLLYRDLGLLNTFGVLVFPGLTSIYNIIVMRNFYRAIPDSLEESAALDGAGWITIWSRIILPLCKPVLATVALWVLMGVWNDWFAPQIYVNSGKYKVVQQILRKYVIENDQSNIDNVLKLTNQRKDRYTGRMLQSATIIAASLPILIIYPFIQKYFTKGIMLGAVKG